jgi:hypothetical protein
VCQQVAYPQVEFWQLLYVLDSSPQASCRPELDEVLQVPALIHTSLILLQDFLALLQAFVAAVLEEYPLSVFVSVFFFLDVVF